MPEISPRLPDDFTFKQTGEKSITRKDEQCFQYKGKAKLGGETFNVTILVSRDELKAMKDKGLNNSLALLAYKTCEKYNELERQLGKENVKEFNGKDLLSGRTFEVSSQKLTQKESSLGSYIKKVVDFAANKTKSIFQKERKSTDSKADFSPRESSSSRHMSSTEFVGMPPIDSQDLLHNLDKGFEKAPESTSDALLKNLDKGVRPEKSTSDGLLKNMGLDKTSEEIKRERLPDREESFAEEVDFSENEPPDTGGVDLDQLISNIERQHLEDDMNRVIAEVERQKGKNLEQPKKSGNSPLPSAGPGEKPIVKTGTEDLDDLFNELQAEKRSGVEHLPLPESLAELNELERNLMRSLSELEIVDEAYSSEINDILRSNEKIITEGAESQKDINDPATQVYARLLTDIFNNVKTHLAEVKREQPQDSDEAAALLDELSNDLAAAREIHKTPVPTTIDDVDKLHTGSDDLLNELQSLDPSSYARFRDEWLDHGEQVKYFLDQESPKISDPKIQNYATFLTDFFNRLNEMVITVKLKK